MFRNSMMVVVLALPLCLVGSGCSGIGNCRIGANCGVRVGSICPPPAYHYRTTIEAGAGSVFVPTGPGTGSYIQEKFHRQQTDILPPVIHGPGR